MQFITISCQHNKNKKEQVLFENPQNKLDFSYKELDIVNLDNNTVNVDYSRLWAQKGHTYGEGLISPDRKFFIFKIPKNASTFLVKNLTELNWEHANYGEFAHEKTIVILRDPVERWVSGIVEYLFLYHENVLGNLANPFNYEYFPLLGEKLGLSLIFEKIVFDDHTERQCCFLKNIDISNTIWFKFDNDLNRNLSTFFLSQGLANNLLNADKVNSSESSGTVPKLKRKLKELIEYAIMHDSYKKYNLEQWMWCDIELYNQVKFYDAR